MKGIILAGGSGTRLSPCTKVTSKQLLPIYDKPMIYYPLETLLRAGITDILFIVAPDRAGDFVNLLGSGQDFGARFSFEVQDHPEGLAQAFLIGESFIDDESVTMILGDNLFEDDFTKPIQEFSSGANIFVKEVKDPERFGVVEFEEMTKMGNDQYPKNKNEQKMKMANACPELVERDQKRILSIEEKPKYPKSNFAMTGLYIFDSTVVKKAKTLKPSARGELEITDLVRKYLEECALNASPIHGQWIDAGTFESMYEATKFVRERELMKISRRSLSTHHQGAMTSNISFQGRMVTPSTTLR